MKIKMICGSLITTASLSSAMTAAGVQPADANPPTRSAAVAKAEPNIVKPDTNPGSTITYSSCGVSNSGYSIQSTTTYTWEPIAVGSATYSWVLTGSTTKQVTSCPPV